MSIKSKRDEDHCCLNGCTNRCCASVVKRARPALDDPTSNNITVLDVLEVDVCRHAILDYVPLGEILRSELVCARWRDAMHHYIRGAKRVRRQLHISAPWHPAQAPRGRALPLDETRDPGFERSLNKWGTSVEAAPCTARSFAIVADNCPNIQELTLYGVPEPDSVRANIEKFQKLKRISFRNFCTATDAKEQHSDQSVGIFLEKETLQELTIVGNELLTGECFTHLQTKLTSLRIQDCSALDHRLLLSAIIHFVELKTLVLSRNSPEILQNINLLLEHTPKLERLELCWYNKMELGDILQVLNRLSSLKHLILRNNCNVDDDWLEALAKGRKLMSLDVSFCEDVTLGGLLVALRAFGPSLEALGVASNDHLRNEDVETIIRLCPNLKLLDIEKCRGVTGELVPYLSRLLRRRRRWRLPALRLRTRATAVPHAHPQIMPNLILDFSSNSQLSAGSDEHGNEPENEHENAENELQRRWFMSLPTHVLLGEKDVREEASFECFRTHP